MDAGVEEDHAGQQGTNKLEEPSGACFDCSICLDFAVEPVVTLCGHLYCWPCIYRWLRQGDAPGPRLCPVCKAALSPTALVPLYGRGCRGDRGDAPRRPTTAAVLPARPPAEIAAARQARGPGSYGGNYNTVSSTTARLLPPTVLGGTPVAILLWALGIERADSYRWLTEGGGGTSPRLRRQEMQERQSLHRISVFFFCCLILCLLAF